VCLKKGEEPMALEIYKPSYDFSIAHSVSGSGMHNTHIHEAVEIFVNISGGKSVFIDGVIYPLKHNDIVFFDSNQIHQVITDKKLYEGYVIVYKNEFLAGLSRNYVELKAAGSYIAENGNIIRVKDFDRLKNMLDEYQNTVPIGDDLRKLACFLNIILYIFNSAGDISDITLDMPKTDGNVIVKVLISEIGKIYKNENFSLTELAAAVHLNKSYMCGLFKKKTGLTILNYISQKRVRDAKAMLTSGVGISECAGSLGFGDYNNFIRVFKKITGTTPGKWKEDK
jgi:YesN/AraC family two-component response regulator